MHYRQDMERCMAYIEAHLDEPLHGQDLAALVGYSYYHFCHVFRVYHDYPIGDYLRKRRLHLARRALAARPSRSVTEIALDYGFATPAGFSKAFRREFGLSPSAYRQVQQNERKGDLQMEAQIREKAAFQAVGCPIPDAAARDYDTVQRAAGWYGKDFSAVPKEEYAKVAPVNKGEIGVWLHNRDNPEDLVYFYGPLVDSFAYVPQGMITLEIPPARYAVFRVDVAAQGLSLEDYQAKIRQAWKYIFQEWFEQNDYTYDESKFNFEYYFEDIVEIYIPIQ